MYNCTYKGLADRSFFGNLEQSERQHPFVCRCFHELMCYDSPILFSVRYLLNCKVNFIFYFIIRLGNMVESCYSFIVSRFIPCLSLLWERESEVSNNAVMSKTLPLSVSRSHTFSSPIFSLHFNMVCRNLSEKLYSKLFLVRAIVRAV
jgi:hypothetical protein